MTADAPPPPPDDLPPARSLDPQESPVVPPNPSSSGGPDAIERHEILFRHSGWTRARARVLAALNRIEPGSDRAIRFETCGAHAWVYQAADDPSRFKIKADYCHDRFCVPCQTARNLRLRAALLEIAKGKHLRFVTLTLATPGMPLTKAIDKLLVSFRRLRSSKLWTRHVSGGVAVLEVKRSSQSARWHPHLHILAEGSFISQSALSTTWRAITRTSFIVHVRAVTQTDQATTYLTKYITKPVAHHVTNSDDLLDEAILAMKARRTLISFGTWYGFDFFRHRDTTEWVAIAPLNRIIREALEGIASSVKLLSLVARRQSPDPPGTHPP